MSLESVKFDRSVSLLCWAYNEEASIGEFLERASLLMASTVEDYEIVLIDDGSTDRTYEIATAFQKKNYKLKIFRNESNLNIAISCQRAIQRASKEFLFWQTIDWSYDISNIRIFLEYLKSYDIVQGVRKKNLTRRSDTILKAIISLINYMFIRLLFRVPLSDFQNVTFYPTKWIQSIKLEAISSFVNPEGLIKSYWNGMSIQEVPINFIPRKKGQAKGTKPHAIISSIRDILRLWFKWVVVGKRNSIKRGVISILFCLFA